MTPSSSSSNHQSTVILSSTYPTQSASCLGSCSCSCSFSSSYGGHRFPSPAPTPSNYSANCSFFSDRNVPVTATATTITPTTSSFQDAIQHPIAKRSLVPLLQLQLHGSTSTSNPISISPPPPTTTTATKIIFPSNSWVMSPSDNNSNSHNLSPASPSTPFLPSISTLHHPTLDQPHRLSLETFYGFVKDRADAVLLVEACVQGKLRALKVVPSGPRVRSGSILVFAESTSMTRWRDGENWSPSRIHGPFLLYREVEAKTNFNSNLPFLKEYQMSRFNTTSFRPKTQPVQHGFAKRTISVQGSDGNRYRVISYFYPQHVEHFYADGNRETLSASTLDLPALSIPSQHPGFAHLKAQVPELMEARPVTPPMCKKRSRAEKPTGVDAKKICLLPMPSPSPAPCSIAFLVS